MLRGELAHWLSIFVVVCACVVGCGGTPERPLPQHPITLSLARSDGQSLNLETLRGQPVLLFLFATYDRGSQLATVPLTRFAEHNPRVRVLGVALQSDARAFLKLHQRALSIPFELYYDPESRILPGKTDLGVVDGVPAYAFIDAQGRLRDLRYGVATTEQLESLAENAFGSP
jgi:peroxiredoxin